MVFLANKPKRVTGVIFRRVVLWSFCLATGTGTKIASFTFPAGYPIYKIHRRLFAKYGSDEFLRYTVQVVGGNRRTKVIHRGELINAWL